MIRTLRTHSMLVLIPLLQTLAASAGDGSDDLETRRDVYKQVAGLEASVDQLTEDLAARQRQLDSIEQSMETVRETTQKLQDLRERLDKLQSLQAELAHWATASLVLGNENTGCALAVRKSPTGYEITSVARHPFVTYAVMTARRARVRRYANPPEIRLVNRILNERQFEHVDFPYLMNNDDASSIASLSFTGPFLSPGARFVVYRDPIADTQRVALFEQTGNSREFLTLQPNNSGSVDKAMTGGSFFAGNADEIEPHIEAGEPFLDYCALSILRTLFSEENYCESPAVAVSVSLDHDLIQMAPAQQTSYFGRYVTHQRTGVVTGDSPLMAFGREMGDQLRNRLARRNVYIVEREFVELVAAENAYSTGERDMTLQVPAEASHLLSIKIDRSKHGGERMALRLVDKISQKTIWSATDDNKVLPSRTWRNYLVQSGNAVIVTFKSDELSARFAALDSKFTESNNPDQSLVAVHEPTDNSRVTLRPLFSSASMTVSNSEVTLTPVTADGTTMAADFEGEALRNQLLPLLTYRFTKHLLAPASRLKKITSGVSGWTATIDVGSRQSLVPGDRFRLKAAAGDRLLPTTASIIDVVDTEKSRVLLTGWDSRTSAASDDLLAICDTRRETTVAIFVPTVSCDNPELKTWKNNDRFIRMKDQGFSVRPAIRDTLFKALNYRGVKAVTGQLEYSVHKDWVSQLGAAQALQYASYLDEIDEDRMAQQAGEMGATHVIGGKMSRLSASRWQVTLALAILIRTPEGQFRKGNSVESVTFVMFAEDWGIARS